MTTPALNLGASPGFALAELDGSARVLTLSIRAATHSLRDLGIP